MPVFTDQDVEAAYVAAQDYWGEHGDAVNQAAFHRAGNCGVAALHALASRVEARERVAREALEEIREKADLNDVSWAYDVANAALNGGTT